MDEMSEEAGHITRVWVNQEGCTSQLSTDGSNNLFEDQSLVKAELKNKPPYLVIKDICLQSNHNQIGSTTVTMCVVCKAVIHISGLGNENHFSSNEHKENQLELFKQYFNTIGLNSTNKVYSYISNTSSINISSATENYINVGNLICFACKHEISSLKSSDDVLIDDVLHHFQHEHHIRNVRDNFSWICNLPWRGYMTFDTTLIYCSTCKESISCNDDRVIQTAVSHLEGKHRKDCINHGLEVETVDLNKMSEDSDSSASERSSDCGQLESEDSLYSSCDDGVVCAGVSEMSLPQMQKENQVNGQKSVNKSDEEYIYVCVECKENIEIIDDDLNRSVEVHCNLHHAKEKGVDSVCPAYINHLFVPLPCKKKVGTLENHGSAINSRVSSAKTSAEEGVQSQEFMNKLFDSNKNKNMPTHNSNRDHEQANFKQKLTTKVNNDKEKKLFSDISDCLPSDCHADLSFVTVKSNQFHCSLCVSFVGAVLNVFESSFILHNHFSSTYHKKQTYIVAKTGSVNNKPSKNKNVSNDKTEDKKNISLLKPDKKLSCYKINQTNCVPVVNIHGSSLNNVPAKLNFPNKTDLTTEKQNELSNCSSKLCEVAKRTELLAQSDSSGLCSTSNSCDLHCISNSIALDSIINVTNCTIHVNTSEWFPSSSLLPPPTLINTNGKTDTTKPNDQLITDLLNDNILRVHHCFITNKPNNTIHCSLCSLDVSENHSDLKTHIFGLTHKVQFLSNLKKSLKASHKDQVKFLLFMNGQLYCSICKCYATPWVSFNEICQGVEAHFELDAHSPRDGVKLSGERCQEVVFKNEKAAMVKGNIYEDPLNLKQKECTSVKDEHKPKVKNVSVENEFQEPCESLVNNPKKVSTLVLDINNCSENQQTLQNTFGLKLKPVIKVNEDEQANNITILSCADTNILGEATSQLPAGSKSENLFSSSTKVVKSSKMELSLKRLLTTSPLVRINKDFIEQIGADFNCILCSKCIHYSPKQYILAKNFNEHFKSASHISTVYKISKVKNVRSISQIFKPKSKETGKLPKDQLLEFYKKKSSVKKNPSTNTSFFYVEMEKVNSMEPSRPKYSDSNLISKSCENKCLTIINTNRVKVCTNKTRALKRFIKKHKLELDLNLCDNNLPRSFSNKRASYKLNPLLQKIASEVPLLQVNKQYIQRRNVNFYCTLCCKTIPFKINHNVFAKYINSHLNSKTHTLLLTTDHSEGKNRKQISEKSSTKDFSTALCQPSWAATKAENGTCNVLNEGKTLFKEIYDSLISLQNEKTFICNYCMKHKRTTPYTSFEYSIIQHCLKVHKNRSKIKTEGVIAEVLWINNLLKANIRFIEVSYCAAACGICRIPVALSTNYNTLICNFLLHFKDEKHKLVFKLTKQTYAIQSENKKSKAYKHDLEAYKYNHFI